MSATHKCPKDGCTVQCPRSRLACRPHWYQVSPATRADVLALWADGDPGEYLAARERAVKEMNSV